METDWFYSFVTEIAASGSITGYPDGTFRPYNTISVAEFIKILISELGYTYNAPVDGRHWATYYM